MKRRFVLIAMVTWATTLAAMANGSLAGARVLLVRVDKQGQGIVVFDQNVSGTPPPCVSSSYANAMSFDANTSGGKAILAMALSAKASGSVVEAYGTGACSVYGNYVEDMNYGVVH